MQRLVCALCLLLAACTGGQPYQAMPNIASSHSAIIGGTLDGADPSVVELFYLTNYPVADCGGDQTCLQTCFDAMGNACTSGTGCTCGGGETCTGELIGPHTVVTAGHCTDTTAGGELTGEGGPALTMCTSQADAFNLANYMPTSNGCDLALFVIFNNTCTTTDLMETCETNLIQNGDFILGDQLVNPGYDGNVYPPYSSNNNDNDIGLVHLEDNSLASGGAEPALLTFNRKDLGAVCTDLGALKFVGYGITDPSQGMNALSGLKYTVTHHALVKDTWHNEEDGAQASPLSTCGRGTGSEPTCSGDSGGPSFNSAGEIVGITSLGDQSCSSYGEDVRIDAYADWIDSTMKGWGDPTNGSVVQPTEDMAHFVVGSPDLAKAPEDLAVAQQHADLAQGGDVDAAKMGTMGETDAAMSSTKGGSDAGTVKSGSDAGTVKSGTDAATAGNGGNGSGSGGSGCGCTVGARDDGNSGLGIVLGFAALFGTALRRRRSHQ